MLRLRPHFEWLLSGAAGAATGTALVVRDAIRVPISDSISEPTLVATIPPITWWLAALIVGALSGAWLGEFLARRKAIGVLRPLLVPGLANLAYIPGAVSMVPFLSSISGPLLDLLILGSVAASLWRAAKSFGVTFSPSANQAAIAALALYLLVGYAVQHRVGPTGDEPHYLLIAHSILHDQDLAVADDYEEGSFRAFYQGKIGPHLAHGTEYSVHGVGLPLVLLPGYALMGLTGVLLTKAVLGAVAVRELFRTVELLVGDRRAALLAAIGFGATVPGLFLLTAAYPELPAAVLALGVFRRWLASESMHTTAAIAWGLSFGLLPLLHIKFITLAAVFLLGSVIYWPQRRKAVVLGAAAGLSAVFVFFHVLTGNLNPLAAWGTQRIFWQGIPVGLAGLFFDQEAGLLPAAPFYVFALIAMGSFLRRQPVLGVLVLATLGAVALPAAAHPAWPGGASAPARYLFPALGLLAAVAAAVWRWESDRGLAPWAVPLLLVSVLFAGFAASVPGQYLYLNQKDETGRLWEAMGTSWDITHYLPSILRADVRSLVMAFVASALLLSAFVLQLFRRKVRLPSLLAVVILATVTIDFVSPGAVPETAMMRWMERLMSSVSSHRARRFVMLPTGRAIGYEKVIAHIELPVYGASDVASSVGESTGVWTSVPFRVPAGELVLQATEAVELDLCNGEGCFETVHVGEAFRARAGLSRFRVRAGKTPRDLRLRAVRLEDDFVTALQSLRLPNGLRMHALDDNAFFEPSGFWVQASQRARFALEQASARTTILSLANGGVKNWISVRYLDEFVQFSLRPFEARRLEIPIADGFVVITVESSTGFRPVDQDPSASDDRALGVFVTAPD